MLSFRRFALYWMAAKKKAASRNKLAFLTHATEIASMSGDPELWIESNQVLLSLSDSVQDALVAVWRAFASAVSPAFFVGTPAFGRLIGATVLSKHNCSRITESRTRRLADTGLAKRGGK